MSKDDIGIQPNNNSTNGNGADRVAYRGELSDEELSRFSSEFFFSSSFDSSHMGGLKTLY